MVVFVLSLKRNDLASFQEESFRLICAFMLLIMLKVSVELFVRAMRKLPPRRIHKKKENTLR